MHLSVETLDKHCPRGLDRASLTHEQWQKAPFHDPCLQDILRLMDQQSRRRFSEWEQLIYTSTYIVISILAVISNGMVILAVVRKRSMLTNRNVLIVNLALSNLMLALTNIPFLWLPSIDFEFPYSRFFCKFANVLPGSNIYCSTLTTCVMAIDRYYSVRKMYIGSGRDQCVRAVCISVCIWATSFLLSFPLLVYYDIHTVYAFRDVAVYDGVNSTRLISYGWRQCQLAPYDSNDLSETEIATRESEAHSIQMFMSVMQVLFLYLVPLVMLSIYNLKLTRFLQINAKHMSRNRAESRRLSDTSNILPMSPSPVSNELQVTASKQKASAAERASQRRTSRTTALLIAMAASYAVLWLPFTIMSAVIDLNVVDPESTPLVDSIDQLCKVISITSICVNPFLYGFLNTNFKHEFRDIFYTWIRCCLPASHNININGNGNGQRHRGENYSSSGVPLNNQQRPSILSVNDSLFASIRRSIRDRKWRLSTGSTASCSQPGTRRSTGTRRRSCGRLLQPSSMNNNDCQLTVSTSIVDDLCSHNNTNTNNINVNNNRIVSSLSPRSQRIDSASAV